jgi:hypothetical protein
MSAGSGIVRVRVGHGLSTTHALIWDDTPVELA